MTSSFTPINRRATAPHLKNLIDLVDVPDSPSNTRSQSSIRTKKRVASQPHTCSTVTKKLRRTYQKKLKKPASDVGLGSLEISSIFPQKKYTASTTLFHHVDAKSTTQQVHEVAPLRSPSLNVGLTLSAKTIGKLAAFRYQDGPHHNHSIQLGRNCHIHPSNSPNPQHTIEIVKCTEDPGLSADEFPMDENDMEDDLYLPTIQESFEPPPSLEFPFDDNSQTNEVYDQHLQFSEPPSRRSIHIIYRDGVIVSIEGQTTFDAISSHFLRSSSYNLAPVSPPHCTHNKYKAF